MSNILITITGDLGSGKSTVCRLLSEQMNLNKYSMGDIQRALAQKYGMTTLEFNIYTETHPEIDDEIDGNYKLLEEKDEDIIVDARMAWHFLPRSYKVFLTVDKEVAAKRILKHGQAGGRNEQYKDLEDACKKLQERKASENLRYKSKYGVDCSDMNNYDLVVDTSDLTTQQMADAIINGYKNSRNC